MWGRIAIRPFAFNKMKNNTLVLGDALTLLVVTLIGFTTHGEFNTSFLPRMLAVYVPLLIGWFLLSPWFGLFSPETTSNPGQLWRPALTMLFAGPLAVVLRGLLLNEPILPIFAVVLSVTSALGLMIWRIVYWFINRGKQ